MKKPADFKYLLFDADGTLFDFNAAEAASLRSVLSEYDIECTDDDVALYHIINQNLWDDMSRGLTARDVLQTERFRIFFEKKGLVLDTVEFNAKYKQGLARGSQLFDGAEELCRTLSEEYTLALITNGTAYTQRSRIDASPVKQYFSGIFISGEMSYQKPQKEYFDTVLREMGIVNSREALIIGDSLLADIAGGINSGIPTCLYDPRYLKNDTGILPDYVVHSYKELRETV